MGDLVVAGEGVWISFKQDSTLRLYNGTTFNHMQDLDIAPAIRRNIGEPTVTGVPQVCGSFSHFG